MTTAIIGFLATWWFGLIIGLFQSLLGLRHKNHNLMFKYVFRSILITIGVTIVFGCIGFMVGNFQDWAVANCCFPYEIVHKKNFVIVGSIHNYGYVGGLIGALCGFAYQLFNRKMWNNFWLKNCKPLIKSVLYPHKIIYLSSRSEMATILNNLYAKFNIKPL